MRNLKRKLEQIGKKYLEKRANDVMVRSKQICPVKTGNLRDSIHVEEGTMPNSKKIGSDVRYARYVEMGTSKMAPRFYLRGALMDVFKGGK